MPSALALGYAGSKDGNTEATAYRAKTNLQKAGTGWNVSNRRWGRSLMDQARLNQQIIDEVEKYKAKGQDRPGIYNLEVQNDEGKAQPGAMMNIGGDTFTADRAGKFRIIDSEYLNEEIEAWEKIQDYETRIVKAILISQESAKTILGARVSLLNQGQLVEGLGLSEAEVGEVDHNANPDVVRYLDKTSARYAQCVGKIKIIVHELGIVLNQEGEKLKSAGKLVDGTRESGQT